jgi:arginyl-tRNA synthetase
MFRSALKNLLGKAIRDSYPDLGDFDISVEPSEQPDHGDYASNIAFSLAKRIQKSPLEIGEDIRNCLSGERGALISRIRVAGSGFLNFTLRDEALHREFQNILANPGAWGRSSEGKGRVARVEYFQLNIAKRPHIGHLRSAVIGDALKRMFLASGWHAVSDTHVGDWGTQFGILLLEFKERDFPMGSFARERDPFSALEDLYIGGNKRIKDDPSRRERAKEEFAKLERGDPENRKLWQWMVEISLKKLEETAGRLGLLEFEMNRPESFYESLMPPIVSLALEKGAAKKSEDGAVVADISGKGLGKAVLVKSDGASTYLLRDLATLCYMKRELQFAKNLYVVDSRQSLHFRQLFCIAQSLGFEGVGESMHVEFGFMRLPEGALSTRGGRIVSLEAVLDEAISRAHSIIREKNPLLENADAVAQDVGIGAIKYFDLSRNRRSHIVFRWDKALSFEGDSGPYLQYTHARLARILRKSGKGAPGQISFFSPDPAERSLLFSVLHFPEAIEDALEECAPHLVARYLLSLAGLANEFYHSHPVLQETDAGKKEFRLALISAVALTLKNGLSLLGIAAPEEM